MVSLRISRRLLGISFLSVFGWPYPEIKEKLKESRNSNKQKLGEKWMSELRTKWPHCVILCSSAKRTMQDLIDLHLT